MTTSNPVHRETAWRVFSNELNASVVEIKATEEKMPSYLVSPLGAKINRVLIAGVLTEKINSGTEDEPMWRARVQDVNGQFFLNIGRFQTEAAATIADLDTPCFVAAVGRVRAYTPEGGRTMISVRPERIIQIDEPLMHEWLLETASSAWTRLKWMKQIVSMPDAKVPDLISMGISPSLAESMLYALDSYDQMPDGEGYLKTIQNALRKLLPEKDIDFGFPEGVEDIPDEIDIDRHEQSGNGSDKAVMEDIVLRLLEELDTDGKGAPRELLEKRAEDEGISSIDLEEVSNALMDKGLVYEPNLRCLKII